MFAKSTPDDNYSGYQANQFYLPVSSSSTRRNEIWERKRQKKGLNAPNSSNKKYQRVVGTSSTSFSSYVPKWSYDRATKPSQVQDYPSIKPNDYRIPEPQSKPEYQGYSDFAPK